MIRSLRSLPALLALALSPTCFITLVFATAPDPPTWMLKWGSLGSAPAQLNYPVGVATDELGNVYVVDQNNQRVQKFDRVGSFITQWGSYGSANGQFYFPSGIATDLSGNVYVVDGSNYRIQKFTGNGTYLTQWGSSGTGPGQFTGLGGNCAVDAAGYVYVADAHRVQKFTSSGAFVTQWGSQGSGDGQFSAPNSVAVDAAGYVYVVDRLNSRLQKFTSTGTFVTKWSLPGNSSDVAVDPVGDVYVIDDNGNVRRYSSSGAFEIQWGSSGTGDGQFNGAKSLDVDLEGNVYVADSWNHRVQKYSGSGATFSGLPHAYVAQWGSAGSGAGQFNYPQGVACDAAGYVYVVDTNNARIQRFTAAGAFVQGWGGFSGNFYQPIGIAADAAGSVYITDSGNSRVESFYGNGAYTGRWGTYCTNDGQFSQPSGIAVGPDGNVYVADLIACRIQKFTSNGTFITKWGAYGTGNGEFSLPMGMATDPLGNVYVADAGNHRIQKFTSAGTYITQWGSNGTADGQFQAPQFVAVDAGGDVYVTDNAHRVQRFRANGAFVTRWGTSGSGDGQFDLPSGIAIDPTGSAVVADRSLHRMQKFTSMPTVAQVSDIRNDQGRQARLRILRASDDAMGSGLSVTGYAIYRRVDPPPPGASAPPERIATTPSDLASRNSAALAGWDYVTTIPARGDAEYSAVVPTLVDANSSSRNYSAFFASALTASPVTYFDSMVESGYSIDNLPPPAPAPFTATYVAGATHLHWGESVAGDFAAFRLYRGGSADFTPGPGNLLVATPDTGYVATGAAGSFYKLSASDFNGNEGPYALLGPGQTTEAPGAATVAFALEGTRPSPATGGRLLVHFALPSDAPATLELIDVTGRRVRERSVRSPGAGRHEVDLAEGAPVKPGLYFIRLTQGANRRVVRATVLD